MSSSLSLEDQKGLFSKGRHETLLCNSALHRPAAFEVCVGVKVHGCQLSASQIRQDFL